MGVDQLLFSIIQEKECGKENKLKVWLSTQDTGANKKALKAAKVVVHLLISQGMYG